MASFTTLLLGGAVGLGIALAFWVVLDLVADLQRQTHRQPR
jgi:hypothetical protein